MNISTLSAQSQSCFSGEQLLGNPLNSRGKMSEKEQAKTVDKTIQATCQQSFQITQRTEAGCVLAVREKSGADANFPQYLSTLL